MRICPRLFHSCSITSLGHSRRAGVIHYTKIPLPEPGEGGLLLYPTDGLAGRAVLHQNTTPQTQHKQTPLAYVRDVSQRTQSLQSNNKKIPKKQEINETHETTHLLDVCNVGRQLLDRNRLLKRQRVLLRRYLLRARVGKARRRPRRQETRG